jgi:hypothetical protein
MTKLEEIETAIAQLNPEEIAKLGTWFDELRADLWDQQIERDIKAGKLDKLADKWRADHAAGKSTEM